MRECYAARAWRRTAKRGTESPVEIVDNDG